MSFAVSISGRRTNADDLVFVLLLIWFVVHSFLFWNFCKRF